MVAPAAVVRSVIAMTHRSSLTVVDTVADPMSYVASALIGYDAAVVVVVATAIAGPPRPDGRHSAVRGAKRPESCATPLTSAAHPIAVADYTYAALPRDGADALPSAGDLADVIDTALDRRRLRTRARAVRVPCCARYAT